ncbi:hypothetical protein Tco_0382608 [Tanacetum coccineum]
MATSQEIIYAPQCGDMIVESVQFKSNNFAGNFSYPQSVPAYKNICKYLRNCFLAEAFSQTPSVLYQNYLREFWCSAEVVHPTPQDEDSEARPLKESNIKFTMKNGKTSLLLDYQTFCQTTGLKYNNRNYVEHPSTEEVKAELAKIATHDVLVHKTPLLKASFPAAWRILMTFAIQVLGGNHSSTEQINSSPQLIVFSLLTGTKIDIREIIYNDVLTRLMAKSRQKYVSYPRFISLSPSEKKRKTKTQTVTVTKPKPKSHGPEASEALCKKGKKAKTKNTTLIQTTLKLDQQNVPSKATNMSQSVSSSQSTDPQDTKGNTQLAVRRLPSTADEDICTSSLCLRQNPLIPKIQRETYTPQIRDACHSP